MIASYCHIDGLYSVVTRTSSLQCGDLHHWPSARWYLAQHQIILWGTLSQLHTHPALVCPFLLWPLLTSSLPSSTGPWREKKRGASTRLLAYFWNSLGIWGDLSHTLSQCASVVTWLTVACSAPILAGLSSSTFLLRPCLSAIQSSFLLWIAQLPPWESAVP